MNYLAPKNTEQWIGCFTYYQAIWSIFFAAVNENIRNNQR